MTLPELTQLITNTELATLRFQPFATKKSKELTQKLHGKEITVPEFEILIKRLSKKVRL
jgi:hypothetical protein